MFAADSIPLESSEQSPKKKQAAKTVSEKESKKKGSVESSDHSPRKKSAKISEDQPRRSPRKGGKKK